MAEALGVRGLMNTSFAIQGKDVYVLEVNPKQPSRTAPFVSKATGYLWLKSPARVMVGQSLSKHALPKKTYPRLLFSQGSGYFRLLVFQALIPYSPEMNRPVEVMGVGKTFGEPC